VDIEHEENTMETSGKRKNVPTRVGGGRRYTDYDKLDLANLADARRWLNAHAGMHEQSQFTPEESARRVAFYAAQVEAEGQITRWLSPAPPKPRARYRTRFAFGDALGKHMMACRI
jgi:hypothetical protein